MDQKEQYQILLDESYNIIYEINQSFQTAICCYNPDDDCADKIKRINEYYNVITQKSAKLICDQIFNGESADEISSNYFYAAVYLYFIYKVFNEKFGGYSEKVTALTCFITEFISQIPDAKKKEILKTHDLIFLEKDAIATEFKFILEQLISDFVYLNFRSYLEMKENNIFCVLANYCKYSDDKTKLYKMVNDAILSGNNLDLWIDTLKIVAYIDMPLDNGCMFNKRLTRRKIPIYALETAVIFISHELLNCKDFLKILFDSPITTKIDLDASVKIMLSAHNGILRKYPSISFLLYKSICRMTYHKCKSYFVENVNPPKAFGGNEKYKSYSTHELEKYSFIDFKGYWAQTRIQKMMFFAISHFADKKAANSALEKETWYQPETQKKILNVVLASKNIPEIKGSFDFSEFNNDAFSATETALNMLYNLARFNDSESSLDIIQQINFIDEQRSRLFLYQDIKPTDRPLDKDKPKSNADRPKWFNQFCPASRANLETEIRTMVEIDCGFSLPVQVQLFPTYNKDVFARKQNCKLFLETDTACNLSHEVFYRNRYKNMLQTRYIYPARNMATHYSKYTPTESLLEEKNFDDLTNFLYDTKSRLEKEQELRKLKDVLKHYELVQSGFGHSWPCLRQSFDELIKTLSAAIKTSEYTGKLKDADVQKIGELESSRKILDILYEVQANYKKEDEFSKNLAETIQYFEARHPDIYCLLKDIINQKEYLGSLNNQQLDKMNESLSPLIRCDNMYYTLSDIRNDYPVDNDLAKELDLYIAGWKREAIVVPKENTELLVKLFQQTEIFFIQHMETLIKVINEAFENKDYDKANQSRHFLQQYANAIKDFDEDSKAIFGKLGLSFYDKTALFTKKEKDVFFDILDKVFVGIGNSVLTKGLKDDIKVDDVKAIYNSIHQILYAQNYFFLATGIDLSEIYNQIFDFIPLYKIRIVMKTADEIKEILTSNVFNSSNNELDVFDSHKLQELINQRKFDEFIAMQTRMEQSIDKYILFYYSKDYAWNFDLFHTKKENEEYYKNLYLAKIHYIKKLLEEKNIDELAKELKRIEYFELPNINFEVKHLKYYSDYLKTIEEIGKKSDNIKNEEIHLLIQKIYDGIQVKKRTAEQEYDKDSVDVFKGNQTYGLFLVQEAKKLLLETIRCCTNSKKVQEELRKNEKVFINKNGKLGLNKNDELSNDIHYTEEFKGRISQFLNTIFGISNICIAKEKKDLDNIGYNDIEEIDVNFFDQYNTLILLYLVRTTVELAHVKKIKI